MEKLVVFLDFANLNRAAQGRRPDYGQMLGYLADGRFLVEAHAFVPRDPRAVTAMDRTVETLWSEGWLVHDKIGSRAGESYKCDFDIEITLEAMRTAEVVRPDIVVLVTGDGDFVPLVLELRRRGIRTEVAAFVENTARELMLRCSGFIDLEVWLNAERDGRLEADAELTLHGELEYWPDRDADDPGDGAGNRYPPAANHLYPR